jgi:hypothetical protein
VSYYSPDVFGHTDAPRGYGVSPDYSGEIDPRSFLEDYLKSGLKVPSPLGDPREQQIFENMINQPRPEGVFYVDPNLLDLREYRTPGPAYPGEFLDRDRFLLTDPRSPLAQLSPRMVRNVYTGYKGDRYVMTPQDKLNMMMDYRDVLDHDKETLRDVFGPLQAP